MNPMSKTASGAGRLYFSRLSYRPVPGVLKSGIPALTLAPAPSITTIFFDVEMASATLLITALSLLAAVVVHALIVFILGFRPVQSFGKSKAAAARRPDKSEAALMFLCGYM